MSVRPRRSGPMVVALEGASGAGKTTVARELSRLLGAHLVGEAYDRLGRSVPLDFTNRTELLELESRLLQEEDKRWQEVSERRRLGEGVVLDTGTAGPLTYAWGLREIGSAGGDVLPELLRRVRTSLVHDRWGLADLSVYLDVPEAVADRRVALNPRTHPAALRERHRRVGRYERILYAREFPRRFPGRFGSVVGEGTPREVALGLQERLEGLGPTPPWSPGESARFLDLFEGRGPAGAPSAGGAAPRGPNP